MAAGTKANVTTGKRGVNGGIYWAPAGTTLPTDATTSLASAFKTVGFVGEDGVTNSKSRETMEIKEWGGETVMSEVTSQSETYKWKSIEYLNTDTLKAVYGEANVAVSSGAVTILVKAGTYGKGVWCIDTAVNGGRLQRIVIPNGVITEIGDIVYVGNDATAFDITLACDYDETLGGTSKIYISATPST